MSHLSLKLKEIMAANRKLPALATGNKNSLNQPGPRKASELSRASGVPNANLSRILSGMQKLISKEDMTQLQTALSKDPAVQAEITAAYMLDFCHGPSSDLVEITIKGANNGKVTRKAAGKTKITMGATRFSPLGEEALLFLRDMSPAKPDIEASIIVTARMLGFGMRRR